MGQAKTSNWGRNLIFGDGYCKGDTNLRDLQQDTRNITWPI